MNKKKKKSLVPLRLNLLFFMVFLFFSLLILRIGFIQIVHGERYQTVVERTENSTVNIPVPRGEIFDRYNRAIVNNKPLNAITYTRANGTTQEEVLDVARKLAELIEKDTSKITERDKKDYWIITHPEEARLLITDSEWAQFEDKDLTDSDLYRIQLERIDEQKLNEIKEEELEILAIFREMTKGYYLTPQIVKNDNVTDIEFATVSENLEILPGVDTTVDWERAYPFERTLRSILGNTTTADEGLPSEKLDYYLSRGYNRNDRVGKSYLEEQYETVLHGQKAQVQNILKGNTLLETKVVREGQSGSDLILTIDMDLQQEVEKILEEELLRAKQSGGSPYLDRAFVVMMDPKTGEILTMAGRQYTVNEGKVGFNDFALGNINTAYEMGSAVKGASVLTGYETGVIQPGSYLVDEPLFLGPRGLRKASYQTMGRINDLTALRRSSNVYMFKIAIAIGKGQYRPYGPLPLDMEAYTTIRNYFSQFGLGVKTGIDLPGETTGIRKMEDLNPGLLLDIMIGQFDTYTPLQLAQYVSTIANGGYRLQPRIVKEIRQPAYGEGEVGEILKPFEPNVLNRIDMRPEYISQVQEGFRQVMQTTGGTAAGVFANKSYKPAGKTGTAQAFYYDSNTRRIYPTWNLTLVGYAPHNNPEVAFSVVVPWAYQNTGNGISNKIGERILDTYFDLKTKNRSNDTEASVDEDDEVGEVEETQD